ncbi:MAG: hypothetical protein V3V59_01740 [Thermodesulfovibrionales bacterium]
MKRKLIVVTLGFVMVMAFGACEQKAEQEKAPVTPHTQSSPGVMMPKGETKIVVPDGVKSKWTAVVLVLEDKVASKAEDITIKLDSEYAIPDSNLKVMVGDYLPDFRMDGLTITSASDQPNNPAVHVKVFEGDAEIFKGWIYSKFPTIHPFQHEKYGLQLKEAVEGGKKG